MKYKLINESYIHEIDSNVSYYQHIKSGARVLCFKNKCDNLTFTIGFRTPPVDNTGLPHILEHSTLCGSKKFPVKDPFVELLKRSLNTFLNAMTFPDKTIYPIASCNKKDYQNLMEVYMDAVFYPNVYKHEEIFKQEGHRLELEDKDKPVTINGVVYNEMKGAFSSVEEVIMRESRHQLFPNTCYGFESGGDPDFIPDLTYQDFLNFHQKLYHPSNSYIVLYGDIDMEEKLNWLDTEYLSSFDKQEVDSHIEYEEKVLVDDYHITYPISQNEDITNKTWYSYSVCLPNGKSGMEVLAFKILSYVLLDAPGAPIKQALIDNGLGEDVLDYFDSGLLQPTLSVFTKNGKDNSLSLFKSVIKTTLQDLLNKGLDKKALLSAINYFEFKYREQDFGSTPTGLEVTIQALESWLYDDNDYSSRIVFEDYFKEIKEELDNNYFENLLDIYMLKNLHVAYLEAVPSKEIAKEKEALLEEKLRKYKESLSDDEINNLIESTKALKIYQDTPSSKEELETIPRLSKEDIDHKVIPVENKEQSIDDVLVVSHDINTNGISYISFMFNTKNVRKELIPYIGCLEYLLSLVSTSDHSYQDLSTEINLYTGGIRPSFNALEVKDNDVLPMFSIKAKAFDSNVEKVFSITKEIITRSLFNDEKRVYELLNEIASTLEIRIQSRGHSQASSRALSYIRAASNYNELVYGISEYQFVKNLLKNFNIASICDKLNELSKAIFRKENLIISYTGTSNKYIDYIKDFNLSLFNTATIKEPFRFSENILNEGIKTSSAIQYVARVGNIGADSYNGSLNVFAQALRYDYLWIKVRVLGGAYGCMSGFSRNGNVYFVSYRDPNLENTMEVYENIPSYINSLSLSSDDILNYIIGAIGIIDTPMNPRELGERQMLYYLQGITTKMLEKEKLEVINTSLDDILKLSSVIQKALDQKVLCVIGNETRIEKSKLFKNIISLS